MNVAATETETPETETAETETPGIEKTVDVNMLYEQACSLIDLAHPGGKLSPIEPTQSEPSPDASILTGSASGSEFVLMIDGSTETDVFDVQEVISTLASRLSETMSLEQTTLGEVTDARLEALSAATVFRTRLTEADQTLGELRLAAAPMPVPAEEDPQAPAESETPTSDAPDQTEEDPQAPAGSETPTSNAPDQAKAPAPAAPVTDRDLAERLPNLAAVDMNVAVELGRVRLPIRELLGLGAGSVIRLGTPVGESFDILVNGKPAAVEISWLSAAGWLCGFGSCWESRTDDLLPGVRKNWIESDAFLARSFVVPAQRFMHMESASGGILLIAAIVAMLWANLDVFGDSYDRFWHASVQVSIGPIHLDETLQHVVNDGLMAIFFFVVTAELGSGRW